MKAPSAIWNQIESIKKQKSKPFLKHEDRISPSESDICINFFFRTRAINCKIYMQNRIPYLFVEFLIFSAFIGFEDLHNVLIAYEDKTKFITFYTHFLDTMGYVLKEKIYI